MVPEYEEEGVCRATNIRKGKRSFFISGGVAPLSVLVSVPACFWLTSSFAPIYLREEWPELWPHCPGFTWRWKSGPR